ncbi:cysteine hydrolase family protein [Rhodococcus sp. NPDC056960]|uniref:cysteine hydrolase family protein n=1 Tax=Rhodococcus sp. NPDC056960 TaxID=3345982 RepID=UPI00363A3118
MASQTPTLVSDRTALLLMDFQKPLLAALPEPDRILGGARRAQRAARAAGIREIHVRVAFTPEDYAAVPSHNKAFASVAENRALAAADPDNDVHPLLRSDADTPTITKIRVGAFSTTSLDSLLREQGIDTLILAGIFTSGVVLSTVRDAADRDYRLLVLSDVCDDPDPTLHHTLMASVLPTQADILDVAAFEIAARTA